MVNSKIWGVLSDIKKRYGFKFVLFGDFEQLKPVEKKSYDVKNSEVFAELVDGQLLELTINYRAINDPEYKVFLEDMMNIREGKTIIFKKYGKKECRKSICWTNRTRKAINQKWNLKESQDVKYVTLKHMRVYKSLPIICKKTTTLNENQVRNNEEFEVVDFDKVDVKIKSEITGDTFKIKFDDLKHFELAYCLTCHCVQGSSFDFDYSIYEWQLFNKYMIYVAISRARARKYINFCDADYKLQQGYIYKITNELTNKIYIGCTKNDIKKRFEEHAISLDGSPLHSAIQDLGHENFKIELVEVVPYIYDEHLFLAETANIIKFNSIESRYNTKLSVSLENLY
jgi:hypothetical protein